MVKIDNIPKLADNLDSRQQRALENLMTRAVKNGHMEVANIGLRLFYVQDPVVIKQAYKELKAKIAKMEGRK